MQQRCFLPNDPRVHLLDFDGFMGGKFDLADQTLLVMDHADYRRLIDSGKFVGRNSIRRPDSCAACTSP